jgi:hypothetical protein
MNMKNFGIDQLNNNLSYPVDIFICCGSYENRCRTIPDIVEPERISHALVVENKDLSIYVGENSQYLRNRFGEKSIDVTTNSSNPLLTADNIHGALKSLKKKSPQKYLIDITTFRHESLLILMNLLKQMTTINDRIDLLYMSASEYSIGNAIKDKWLSKGVAGVRSILGYSGDFSPSKKMHLVIIVGYEYQRASALIDNLEPNQLSLGLGRPSTSTDEKHKAAQEFFYKLLKNMMMLHGNVNEFEFSCNNPLETRDAILAQSEKFPDYNVVVAPMNTKLSTVGAGLATFINNEIQLCYAQAEQYNNHGYSLPGTNCYMFELSKYLPEFY